MKDTQSHSDHIAKIKAVETVWLNRKSFIVVKLLEVVEAEGARNKQKTLK